MIDRFPALTAARHEIERRRRAPLTGEIREHLWIAPGAVVRMGGIMYAEPETAAALREELRSLEAHRDAWAEVRLRRDEAMRWADDGGSRG